MNEIMLKRGVKPSARFNLWVLVALVVFSLVAIVKAQTEDADHQPVAPAGWHETWHR